MTKQRSRTDLGEDNGISELPTEPKLKKKSKEKEILSYPEGVTFIPAVDDEVDWSKEDFFLPPPLIQFFYGEVSGLIESLHTLIRSYMFALTAESI